MGETLSARLTGAPRTARRALSFVALFVVVLVSACGDDSLLSPATRENAIRSYSVWAINGASAAVPAAYSFVTEALERPQILANGAVNFDVAFDITGDGRVAVIPVRDIVPLPPKGAPTIALQASPVPFERLERAPDRGYVADSTITAGVGETVLLRIGGAGCLFGDPYYAKVVVDSVILSERRVVLRSLVNRNCGYRALTEGIPRN